MLKWYVQPIRKFNGLNYRARDIVLDEKMIEKVLKVPEAIIVSSWRSLEEQKTMVAKGASKTLQSNHRRGMAVDIVNWKELDKKLESVGLVNDISWDQNHYTLEGESKTATKYPMYDYFVKNEKTKYKYPTSAKDAPVVTISNLETVEKNMTITKELQIAIEELVGENFGKNLDEKEQQKLAILLTDYKRNELIKSVEHQDEILKLNQRNEELSRKLGTLSTPEKEPVTTQNLKPVSVVGELIKAIGAILKK